MRYRKKPVVIEAIKWKRNLTNPAQCWRKEKGNENIPMHHSLLSNRKYP